MLGTEPNAENPGLDVQLANFQQHISGTTTTNTGPSNTGFVQPAQQQPDPSAQNAVVTIDGQVDPPAGDTDAAEFVAKQKTPAKPNPLPHSSLRTGFCYDIRMRFHQTVDYRDTHPEDPRRIYRIYKELALAGLIDDRESPTANKDELMLRLRSRYATEEEILLVHSKEHLAEMHATQSLYPSSTYSEDRANGRNVRD